MSEPKLFYRPRDPAQFYLDLTSAGPGVAIPCRNAPEIGTLLPLDVMLPGATRALRVTARIAGTRGVRGAGAAGREMVVVKLADSSSREAESLMRAAMRPMQRAS